MKGGRISGKLPTKEAFAVHYPAYPSSLDRAVDTLGGAQAIAKTHSSDTNKLELRFRPEDPYSHPVFGDLHACNHFLLKISKKIVRKNPDAELTNGVLSSSSVDPAIIKQKATCSDLAGTTQPRNEAGDENITLPKKIESQAPKEDEECLDADLVAHIREAYHFNGMVDYQHVIAVHANAAQQKKRNWADFENGGLIDVDQEDLMILVPPLFSQKDKPEKVLLKPSASNSLKKKPAGVLPHHWEMTIEPSLALDFSIKEVPKKVNWEKYIPEDSEQWLWQKTVCELFEERPIWVKDSLSERLLDKGLEFGGNLLRRLLFRAAYYFANGPFLRFWIRKGYDPRKDPESRIYQRTDFRVPPSLQGYGDVNAAPGLRHRWEDICAFRSFPVKYQTSFQLLELADDYIQQEIRKPPSLVECNHVTGWFLSHVLDRLRLCVSVRFLSIYPKEGAKPFLKDVSARFERSKLSHIFPKNVKVTEEVEQANREVPEEKEMDYDEDEEDEEDDNIEEDLDADQIELQGRNFSPEAHSCILETYSIWLCQSFNSLASQNQNLPSLSDYLLKNKHQWCPIRFSDTDQENMSRNYLQDLFDSFPFDASGENGVLDTNNSDGEYQIYEQYSDRNCSDDDEL